MKAFHVRTHAGMKGSRERITVSASRARSSERHPCGRMFREPGQPQIDVGTFDIQRSVGSTRDLACQVDLETPVEKATSVANCDAAHPITAPREY